VELGPNRIVLALGYPFGTHDKLLLGLSTVSHYVIALGGLQ